MEQPSSSNVSQQHAVVIGGSMAGLLAARVLADYFQRVTVLERDVYPQQPAGRRGLPQARHVHLLLARGREIMENLFPGFTTELLNRGARQVDVIGDVEWFGPSGWSSSRPSGITTPACPRDLLDWTIRQRLLNNYPQITFIEGTEAVGLVADKTKTWVTGVRVRSKAAATVEDTIGANLIVDATGRQSKAPQWLKELGYPEPTESRVSAFIGYASRIYERPAMTRFEGILMQPLPPQHRRGGALFPLDAHRWIVTLSGAERDYPPTDEAGFLEFARNLRDPLLYNTIKDAIPLSNIIGSRSTENRWRHYEQLARQPEGFILVGDAVCALNPVYGQGMSVAALGATTLTNSLSKQLQIRPAGDLYGFAHRFQRKLAAVNRPAWLLATGEDFRYAEAVGRKRTLFDAVTHRSIDLLIRRANHDPALYKRLVKVMHLLRSPISLATPSTLLALILELLESANRTSVNTLHETRV